MYFLSFLLTRLVTAIDCHTCVSCVARSKEVLSRKVSEVYDHKAEELANLAPQFLATRNTDAHMKIQAVN